MMPEERLVRQIRDFVRTENPEPTPEIEDLAEQYAELCEVVNERLMKCGDFLDKGMRSEAVYEMQVPPPLLEQVGVLNFREVTKWRNLCDDFGMRVFTPLRVDIVDRLRAEATTEEALAPLLNEYRRLVHHGSRDDRIRILRRIREHDPDNPVWYENLAPLEEAQLEDLVPEAEEALRKEDLRSLARLREELEHPQRACPPPEELTRQVASMLRSSELRDARAKADELAGDIEAAYDDQDEERLERLLANWDDVTADEELRVDAAQRERVENVRQWLHKEQNKRQRDRTFQETLAALESQITRDLPDRDEVRQLWRELMTAERAIPGDVRERVMTAISRVDEYERANRRKRILIGTVAAAAILAVIVGLGFVVHTVQTRNRIERGIASLVQSENYQEALAAIQRARTQHPSVYATPAVQQLRSRAEQAIESRQQQRARFEATMDKLRAIQEAGYDATETRVQRLLQQAESLAVEDQQKARIQSWRDTRELAEMREQKQERVRFNQAVQGLKARVEANVEKGFATFQQEQAAIDDLRNKLAEVGASGQGLPEKILDALDPIAEQLATWQRRLDDRIAELEDRQQRRERSLRAIRNAPPDLGLFITLMRGFVEDYPDDPNVPRMRRLINDATLFQDLLAIQGLTVEDLPLSDTEKTAVEQALQGLPQGERSIWHQDLSAALAATERFPQALTALNAIRQLPGLNLKVFEVRPRDTQIWRKIYYPETVRDRDGELYWGRVYRTSPEEPKPWIEHRKFSAEEYEVRISRRDEANLVPHAKYARELAERIRNRKDRVDVFLVDVMMEVLNHDELPPIAKGWLLDICSQGLQACTVNPIEDLQQIRDLLGDIPREDNWFHRDHEEVAQLNDRLVQAFARFPDIAPILQTIRRQQALLASTLSRQPRYAGRVMADEEGKLRLDIPADVPEAWVIRVNRQRRAREILVVSRPGADGPEIAPDAEDALYDGQLLFAPGDDRRTDTILRALDTPAEQARRHPAWPRQP